MSGYLKGMRVRTVLTTMLALFVVLFALASAGGLGVLRDTGKWVEALGRDNLERGNALSDVTVSLLRAQTLITDARVLMESGMEEERDVRLASAAEQLAAAETRFANFVDGLDAVPAVAEEAAPVVAAYRTWMAEGLMPWFDAVQGWNGIVAQRVEQEQVGVGGERFLATVATFQDALRKQGATAVASVRFSIETTIWVALAVLAGVMALALLCRVFVGRVVLRPLAEVARHLRQIANGDLSAAVAPGPRNEIGVLQNSLRAMQDDLKAMVGALHASAEAIDARTADMTADNADLGGRTEAQAATLQETAASMAWLAEAVQSHMQQAMHANSVTTHAAEQARRGGDAADGLAAAMRDITRHTHNIIEVVKVIDDLAFQTNLLSLNAAVEAAHAGEHGKGFAVVAAEVRSLAQRSATSADEIRHLVDAAGRCVDAGMREVEHTGQTMRDISGAVQEASVLARDLAQGSQRQAGDIARLHEAIGELDRATQANALLVEQATRTAVALQEQGGALKLAAAAFRMGDAAPSSLAGKESVVQATPILMPRLAPTA